MWRRRMTVDEYRRLGLSERPVAERRLFLGAYGALKFSLAITGRSARRGLVGDKLYFDTLMAGAGFPVVTSLGVIGRAGAARVPELRDGPALRKLLRAEGGAIFIKPVVAQGVTQPIAVMGYDAGANLAMTSEGTMAPRKLLALAARRMPQGALVQRRLRQHGRVAAAIGSSIGSLRLTTLMTDAGPRLVQSFWRIPCGAAVADHLWRGNLVAALDGNRVVRAVDRLDAQAPVVEVHPTTGAALRGFDMPDYGQALALAQQAAAFLCELPLIGWDIALTEDGPVIVEANANPSLDLPQYLSGEGVLSQPDLAAAWAERASKRRAQARARRARRLSAFRLQRNR
ncbi:MAG: sugar-transfer associated ATP-grasp domain-containing protein [Pseudomonadota bacterium]